MELNDHTDAEMIRREHAYEMGRENSQIDTEWERWCDTVEAGLIEMGFSTPQRGIDGDQSEDGFSIDFAVDDFDDGLTPIQYLAKVAARRKEMGL